MVLWLVHVMVKEMHMELDDGVAHLTGCGIRNGEVTQSGLSPLAAPSSTFSHAVVPQSLATLIEKFVQSPVTPNLE